MCVNHDTSENTSNVNAVATLSRLSGSGLGYCGQLLIKPCLYLYRLKKCIMQIRVVEDDERLAALIKRGLKESGYMIAVARGGQWVTG